MNPLAITTNRAEAVATIKAALEAGTLTAPHGLHGTYAGKRPDGVLCHCAVGVLYPSATAYALEHLWADFEDETVAPLADDLAEALRTSGNEPSYAMASMLINKGLLVVPPEETLWFIELQRKQDKWARAIGDRLGHDVVTAAREAFFNHLKL